MSVMIVTFDVACVCLCAYVVYAVRGITSDANQTIEKFR